MSAVTGPEDFIHTRRVAWSDCDPALIAYTGKIPDFALEAIDRWWQHVIGINWFQAVVDHRIGTPFVRMEMDFVSPIHGRGDINTKISLIRLGNSSLTFAAEGRQDDRLCFRGKFVCVYVTQEPFGKANIPDDYRTILTRHLQPDQQEPAA